MLPTGKIKYFSSFYFRIIFAFLIAFLLLQCEGGNQRIIKLETGEATSVTTSTASLSGNIIDLGEITVQQHGHCWSTSPGASLNNSFKDKGTAQYTGNYTSSITDLIPDRTYYYKAYAVSGENVTYGEELSFSTQNGIIEVATGAHYDVTSSSFLIEGDVLSDGGAAVTAKGICWNSASGPTLDNTIVSGGTGTGIFTVPIDGLTVNTPYYLRAYATNSVGTQYGDEVEVTLWLNQAGPDLTDQDGNTYNSIRIGTQVWMAQSLKTTKYNDGISISAVTGDNTWMGLTSAAYSWYENDANDNTYHGALYNWYAVDTEKLCPSGWHIPSNEEYITLEEYLESTGGNAGGMMKQVGTGYWETPNTGANNESGFGALGAGFRGDDGAFYAKRYIVFLWTSSPAVNDLATAKNLDFDKASLREAAYSKVLGGSVRCVQDP